MRLISILSTLLHSWFSLTSFLWSWSVFKIFVVLWISDNKKPCWNRFTRCYSGCSPTFIILQISDCVFNFFSCRVVPLLVHFFLFPALNPVARVPLGLIILWNKSSTCPLFFFFHYLVASSVFWYSFSKFFTFLMIKWFSISFNLFSLNFFIAL